MVGVFVRSVLILSLVSSISLSVSARGFDEAYFDMGELKVTELPPTEIRLSSPLGASANRSQTASTVGLGTCATSPVGLLRLGSASSAATGAVAQVRDALNPLDQVEVTVDKVINIGKKIWKVVEAGKPVVNLRSDVATALPPTASGKPLCWTALENWQMPQSKVFGAVIKNAYGLEVVRFQYRILYVYGGQVSGKGRYIGYATIQPSSVSVAWGYQFHVHASAPAVFNMGSHENPVAGMNLELTYTVKTVLKEVTDSKTYFISGAGHFSEVP